MKSPIRLAMLLLGAISYSCTNLNDSGPIDDTSTLSLLVANQDPQRLYVYQTASLDEFDNSGSPPEVRFSKFFIDNAGVLIKDASQKPFPFKFQIDTVSPSAFRKSFVPESLLTVQPNTTYSLSVIRGTTVIQGETTVPGDFTVTKPVHGQVFSGVNRKLRLDFAWTSSNNAQVYRVDVTRYRRGLISLFSLTNSYDVFDTTFVMPGVIDVYAPDTLYVEIYSFDKNHYRHRFKSVARSGITGGYGYFGSAVLKKLVVYVN